jgi:O-acetylserine/cysteine efflux transporter
MQLSHFFLAVLVFMIWGFNFVVVKLGLEEIPPLVLGFARLFLTSIPAVFFIKRPKVPLRMVVLYGLVMFALHFGLLFMGMNTGVPPGLTSLLLQFQIFFTVLLGVLFFGEKLHPWQIIGGLVSLTGIVLIGMHMDGGGTLTGFLLVIGSAVSWGIGNLISKKIGKVDMIALVIWGSFFAWPPFLALSLMTEGVDKFIDIFRHVTWVSTGSVLYITYLSTLVGYGSWSFLVHHHPFSTIAPFALLVPVFGMLSSIVVLGEPLQEWKVFAGVLVVSGLCINFLFPRIFRKAYKQ